MQLAITRVSSAMQLFISSSGIPACIRDTDYLSSLLRQMYCLSDSRVALYSRGTDIRPRLPLNMKDETATITPYSSDAQC